MRHKEDDGELCELRRLEGERAESQPSLRPGDPRADAGDEHHHKEDQGDPEERVDRLSNGFDRNRLCRKEPDHADGHRQELLLEKKGAVLKFFSRQIPGGGIDHRQPKRDEEDGGEQQRIVEMFFHVIIAGGGYANIPRTPYLATSDRQIRILVATT